MPLVVAVRITVVLITEATEVTEATVPTEVMDTAAEICTQFALSTLEHCSMMTGNIILGRNRFLIEFFLHFYWILLGFYWIWF